MSPINGAALDVGSVVFPQVVLCSPELLVLGQGWHATLHSTSTICADVFSRHRCRKGLPYFVIVASLGLWMAFKTQRFWRYNLLPSQCLRARHCPHHQPSFSLKPFWWATKRSQHKVYPKDVRQSDIQRQSMHGPKRHTLHLIQPLC